MILFCVGFLFFGLAGQASAATYYVSPTGSNTSPYDTWAKAANVPNTVISLNPAGGPHLVLIGPGIYTSYINALNAAWNGGIVFGVSAAGVSAAADSSNYTSYPAADTEVTILATATKHALFITATGFEAHHITFADTDATHVIFYDAGTNTVLRHIHFRNAGAALMNLTGTGLDVRYFIAEGSGNAYGIVMSGSSSGTLSYGIIRNSTTMAPGTEYAIRFFSSGTFVLNNLIITGSASCPIWQNNTGTMTIVNSIIHSSPGSIYLAVRSAGSLTIDHSFLVPNVWYPVNLFQGTVTDTNNIKTAKQGFVRRQFSGFFVPTIDDGSNYAYAMLVATELKTRGLRGTWYVPGSSLATPAILATVQSAILDGTLEIGCHSWSHSDLTLTGNVFSITKVGSTVNVDRANDQIVVSGAGGGTISGFKAKTLDVIRTELTAFGCTLGSYRTNQGTEALGEIMADSSGAQASPYSPQYLIDTTANSGLFKSEIRDAKATMEAILGISLTSFSTPYATKSADLATAVINAGFASNRVGQGTGTTYYLNGIDLGAISHSGSLDNVADDDTLKYYTRTAGEFVGNYGAIYVALAHSTVEMTIARWRVVLDEILEYPEITVASMGDVVNTIKTSGTWSTADNRIYTRTWTDQSNYQLLSSSPNIDASTDVGLTTDYAGNSIYGTPDIGAYEYQPPYTIGTNEVDVSAEVRVYADGKFRNIGTAGGTTADLTITPSSGSFTSDTSAWMDVTDITWNTTGDYSKQWTESSTFSGLTNTVHTIGDLEANTYYNITVDSSTTNLSGTNCNTAGSSYTCLSNSNGEIIFTYQGTYSTHTFGVTEGDNTVPAISGVISTPTSTGATITWTTDEASSSLVEYGLTSSYGTSTSEADTGTRVTSHSVLLSGLSTCTRYYYRVHSKDATTNESIVVGNSFLTTECGGGGLPSGAYAPPTTPTGGFKVSVNSNAETTNSPNVTLSLTAGTDVKNMAISNLLDFTNATQEPYQSTKQWDLCQQRTTCPAGQYTVYVKFYTQYGQVSEVVSASIKLDSRFRGNDESGTTAQQQKLELIAKIKKQLISLITQLIQMLYLEVEQMRR